MALFPDKRFNPLERDTYNRAIEALFEDIRDFIVLHYFATQRDDSDFWRMCRSMSIPDTLAEKIELFRSKARTFREGVELFSTTSWVAVLLGQNIRPEGYDPIADALDEERVSAALEQMRGGIMETVARMPTHAEFIARCCAADDPMVRAAQEISL
jgi:tryptophan halogenase